MIIKNETKMILFLFYFILEPYCALSYIYIVILCIVFQLGMSWRVVKSVKMVTPNYARLAQVVEVATGRDVSIDRTIRDKGIWDVRRS